MNAVVLHYKTLRRLVGILGVAIPLVLPLGLVAFGEPPPVRASISAYHATAMRDVFVALVACVGVFLFAYRGYDGHKVLGLELDRTAGTFASGCAALIAFCPYDGGALMNALHLVGGTGMFASFAFFSLFLFTRTSGNPTPQKLLRNRVYRICGVTILVCMVLMGIVWIFLDGTWLDAYSPTFWLEAVMLNAFGISWCVKGDVILADD